MSARIMIDPMICNGRPVVRGTRITAQTIVEFVAFLAAGDSIEDVLACLTYSSQVMGHRFAVDRIA